MKTELEKKDDEINTKSGGVGFSAGGWIRGCDSTVAGLVHHSESFFFMDKETLKNGISKLQEINNNAKIEKTED